MRKRFAALRSVLFLLVLALSVGTALAQPFPKIIPLPNGFQPEGVAIGYERTMYSGSLANGAIYRANLRTGEGQIAVPPQDDRVAAGLSFDMRSGFLFVAGGPTGSGYVYDVNTGESMADYQFTTEPSSFVNDVIVTESAAYFTDSFRPVLYRLPLDPGGGLSPAGVFEEIALGGEFNFVAAVFNANGIDATPKGDTLVIVNTTTGELYRVDPETGVAALIDLGGGSVPNGDGMLLDGLILYVVQNSLNQIAVIRLNPELTAGEIEAIITDPDFDVPTTIAEFGNNLYAVNARFGTPAEPGTEYSVVRVAKTR
jgi:sugar lactone lactonase YvrE